MPFTAAEAVASVIQSKDIDPQQWVADFNALHARGVKRDVDDMVKYFESHPKLTSNGRIMPRTVSITPVKALLRSPDKSFVREDFEGPTCAKFIMLRYLYRATCPAGLQVSFNGETKPIYVNSVLENVFIPTASFSPLNETVRSRRRR